MCKCSPQLNISEVSIFEIYELFENTSRMSRITTFITIVKIMFLDSFFFTNIAIIFTKVILNIIMKNKGLLVLSVIYGAC